MLQRLSFWKVLPSPHRNSGTWPSGSWSPSWPWPFSLIGQFGWAASSRKSLGGSKLLTFKSDGGHCVLGDQQCCRNVSVPRSVPRSLPQICASRQSCLGTLWTIPSTSWLGFCIVNCGTLYRKACPINLTSHRCRNISRMINGNRMYLSSISSLKAKSLNTYVNKVFQFYIFMHLLTFLFSVFTLSLWRYCVLIDEGKK